MRDLAGATISDLVERGPMLAETAKPSIVHVMLGTNDALRQIFTGATPLKGIVERLQAGGARVVLWTLPPIAEGAGDPDAFTRVNDTIRTVADETGASLEDKWTVPLTGADGFAAPGWLVGDGVHLSPNGQIARASRIAEINADILNGGLSCKH